MPRAHTGRESLGFATSVVVRSTQPPRGNAFTRAPGAPGKLIIAALLLGCGALAATGASYYRTTDFFCFYEGARFVVERRDPYDLELWRAAISGEFREPLGGTGSSSCGAPYAYPLWTAFALVPFGALPLEAAAVAWATLAIAGAAGGSLLAWRAVNGPASLALVFGVIVVFAQPFWILLISGQMAGLLLLLLGVLVWALRESRPRAGGTALALLALKPHLILLLAPAVIARSPRSERSRLIGTCLGVLGTLVALSVALQPEWPLAWLSNVGVPRAAIATLLPTAWGFAADMLGSALWGAVLIVLVVAGMAALLRGGPRGQVELAIAAIPVSLFAAPHAWSYDFLLLSPCWALILTVAGRQSAPTRIALLFSLLCVASIGPWLLYGYAFTRGVETASAVIPAATALLVAAALRIDGRARSLR